MENTTQDLMQDSSMGSRPQPDTSSRITDLDLLAQSASINGNAQPRELHQAILRGLV